MLITYVFLRRILSLKHVLKQTHTKKKKKATFQQKLKAIGQDQEM